MPLELCDAEQIMQGIDHLRAQLGPPAFTDAGRLGAAISDSEIVSFTEDQTAMLIDATG